jgi:hypothetical protein
MTEGRVEQGWIYVLVNSSIPGLAKVGRTTRSPVDRAAELSGATGVATPFVLAFDQAFADCYAAEKAVHGELDRRGLRVAPNREFFRGSAAEVVRVVLEAADASGQIVSDAAVKSAQAMLAAGDRSLIGMGDALQDTGEAVRCYRLAASRGSLVAFERLGQIFGELYAVGADRVGRRRALMPLKQGAKRGNYYCYAEMAALFAREGHVSNVQKAWELFFVRRADSRLDELEDGSDRMTAACCRYIGTCLSVELQPGHRAELLPLARGMVAALLDEFDSVRGDEVARQRVAGILRWVYVELLPAAQPPRPRGRKRFSWPFRGAWLPQSQGVGA